MASSATRSLSWTVLLHHDAHTHPFLGPVTGNNIVFNGPAPEDLAAAVDATPLLILDQFEDHFLYEPDDNDGFDDDLARCVNRRDLRANFLISVREDAYSLIGPRFKARIPNIYGNYLHLDFLDERAAREAVLEPVGAFNERLAADAPPQRRTATVGGIALVCVDLEQRTGVEQGLIHRIVPARIVGMDRVTGVG